MEHALGVEEEAEIAITDHQTKLGAAMQKL
jgi:hypothetical protein